MQTPVGSGTLIDKMLAFDILKDSKYCITSLSKASTATAHAQLRSYIDATLNECVQDHFKLADMLIVKGWYHPSNLEEQLQADFAMASKAQSPAAR